jgi:hypothetical protein
MIFISQLKNIDWLIGLKNKGKLLAAYKKHTSPAKTFTDRNKGIKNYITKK